MNGSVLLLLACLGGAPKPPIRPVAAEPRERKVELRVRGVIPLHPAKGHILVLATPDQEILIPILVDEPTAVAAAFRLSHQAAPVPLSQDLSANLLRRLGGEVTEVWLEGTRQTRAQGRVLIRQGERRLSMDALPGDAVLLALSQEAPIFATRQVVAASGIKRSELNQLPKRGVDQEEEAPGVGGSGPPEKDPETSPGISL